MSEQVEPGCPRCENALSPRQEGGMTGWVCARGDGVWLDNEMAQRLVRAELPHQVLPAFSERAAPPAGRVAAAARCPFCAAPLTRVGVPAAHLDVDVCDAHGTWFDRGELERVWRGFERARRDREEIRELLQQPGENVYVRGLKQLPIAAAQQLEETARALSELELVDDDDRWDHHDGSPSSPFDLLWSAARLVRSVWRGR